ncbi:hypothetical protein MBANPS3_011877 [Mucor bainieri]
MQPRCIKKTYLVSLLYYSIIGLVTSSKSQPINKVLNKPQIKEYRSLYKTKFVCQQDITIFTKTITDLTATQTLKQALKKTKDIDLLPEDSLKAQK